MPARIYECLHCGDYFEHTLTHLDPEYCCGECRNTDTEAILSSKLPKEYENATITSPAVAEALETVRASGGFVLKMATKE